MDGRLRKFLNICDAHAKSWTKLREALEQKNAKGDLDWGGLLERMQTNFEKQVGEMYLSLMALRGNLPMG